MPFDVPLPLELHTGALTLRALSEDDWTLEYILSRIPDVPQWTYYPAEMDEAAARRRIRRTRERQEQRIAARYVVILDGETLGTVGMGLSDNPEPEIFYVLLPEARGRGVATRAAQVLCDWLFSHGFDQVALETVSGNTPSERVAERAGFIHVSTHQGEHRGRTVQLKRWIRSRPDGS
ncbi:GNAT family N-acetyltransferase [Arthrobacter sp. H14]|uniref:GNAT family N-acetyltransferase n=1 Tax=Arthrobacter sp. H14 TaxID=1312959 RepID=UPI00047E52BC|nr:GNAT family protein [Arthrobacter sp. H14]